MLFFGAFNRLLCSYPRVEAVSLGRSIFGVIGRGSVLVVGFVPSEAIGGVYTSEKYRFCWCVWSERNKKFDETRTTNRTIVDGIFYDF